MNSVIMYVVGGLVVMVIAAALVPTALQQFHNANTTGFTSGELAIFNILGVIMMIGLLIGLVYMAIKKK